MLERIKKHGRREGYAEIYFRPWSMLQRDIYKLLLNKELKLQINCTVLRFCHHDVDGAPKYWITLGRGRDKETIWRSEKGIFSSISSLSNLMREYIDTPEEHIFEKVFEADKWGLTDILKAADRRISKQRLDELRAKTENAAVIKVLNKRLDTNEDEIKRREKKEPVKRDKGMDVSPEELIASRVAKQKGFYDSERVINFKYDKKIIRF